jgi:intron-binding protein aquarius
VLASDTYESLSKVKYLVPNIIRMWRRNKVKGRCLIVTRTNQLLNDTFENLLHFGFDEDRLVRLGHGEKQLHDTRDFSRKGRVDFLLSHRLELLEFLRKFASSVEDDASMSIGQGASYSCDSAHHYFVQRVQVLWSKFWSKFSHGSHKAHQILQDFPFQRFFANRFSADSDAASVLRICNKCFSELQEVFQKLRELRPLEVLKGQSERSSFVLTQFSEIVAVTSTYAALNRESLLGQDFNFESILILEGGKMFNAEDILPCFLQQPLKCVKRMIIFGNLKDGPHLHSQDAAKFGNHDQSLFHRLMKAGHPHISL